MRFIATLLLIVACAVQSWAGESFTADELRGIDTQMAGVQTGTTKVYTITRGDKTYNLELTANADGTYAVGGNGVPSGFLGALKFTRGRVDFKAQGEQQFATIALRRQRIGQITFDRVRGRYILRPGVVEYVLVTSFALETNEIIQAGPYDS